MLHMTWEPAVITDLWYWRIPFFPSFSHDRFCIVPLSVIPVVKIVTIMIVGRMRKLRNAV